MKYVRRLHKLALLLSLASTAAVCQAQQGPEELPFSPVATDPFTDASIDLGLPGALARLCDVGAELRAASVLPIEGRLSQPQPALPVVDPFTGAVVCHAQDPTEPPAPTASSRPAQDRGEQVWRDSAQEQHGDLQSPQEPALIDRGLPGVLVRLYDVGVEMSAVPTLRPGQLPNMVRVLPTVDLDGEHGDFAPLEDRFVTEVTGFINLNLRARYTLRLLSDDGAQLWVNGRLAIDNDGLHGPEPKTAEVELIAGQNAFRILHFDAGGGERLALLWKVQGTGQGDTYAPIPAGLLTHDSSASFETSSGRKEIVTPLRRGLPGDGSPLQGMHPGFKREPFDAAGMDESELQGLLRMLRMTARLGVCNTPQNELIKVLSGGPGVPAAQLRRIVPRGAPANEGLLAWMPPDADAQQPRTLCSFQAGTYAEQVLVADGRTNTFWRAFVDREAGKQACVFRFAGSSPDEIPVLGSVSNGDIVVGGPGLSLGAGAKQPVLYSIVPSGRTTFEMHAVRALSNGLEIAFTKPLDERVGWDPECYYVEQWPYDVDGLSPPTRDGTTTPVKSASVAPDRRRVFLEIDGLQPAHVVYLRLLPPCLSEDGERPWSTEAWYTLRELPTGRPGKVLPPPATEPQNVLSDEERDAGWKLLFDGRSTAGWRGYRKDTFPDEGWQVKDGCLVRVGPGGDFITEQEFDNFELALEWRICAGGNSGIFFRVDEQYDWPWESGPEMQVLDNAEHKDGQNPRTSAGSNYALHAPLRDVTQPVGLFNQARIVVAGDNVQHWLNGVKIVEYQLGSPEWEQLVADSKFSKMPHYGRVKKGHIVLQDHGDKVWYRNIKIRALPGE